MERQKETALIISERLINDFFINLQVLRVWPMNGVVRWPGRLP